MVPQNISPTSCQRVPTRHEQVTELDHARYTLQSLVAAYHAARGLDPTRDHLRALTTLIERALKRVYELDAA